MKIDWKRKLTSRKLWVSLANFVSMLYIYFGHAVSDGEKIAAIILAGGTLIGYTIGEGLADSGNVDNSTSLSINNAKDKDKDKDEDDWDGDFDEV